MITRITIQTVIRRTICIVKNESNRKDLLFIRLLTTVLRVLIIISKTTTETVSKSNLNKQLEREIDILMRTRKTWIWGITVR